MLPKASGNYQPATEGGDNMKFHLSIAGQPACSNRKAAHGVPLDKFRIYLDRYPQTCCLNCQKYMPSYEATTKNTNTLQIYGGKVVTTDKGYGMEITVLLEKSNTAIVISTNHNVGTERVKVIHKNEERLNLITIEPDRR